MNDIETCMRNLTSTPRYIYSWPGLQADLERDGRESFPCVGYGSLVNRASAARTLRGERKAVVIAFGVRRVFNLFMEDAGLNRYSLPANPKARAALNVISTGQSHDAVNGVLFDVATADIPTFRAREVGYDLIPVACIDWTRRDDPAFTAYILACPNEPRDGKVRTRRDIEPHVEYYELCRAGAAALGDEFLRFWLATTFLADGITPMTIWERR